MWIPIRGVFAFIFPVLLVTAIFTVPANAHAAEWHIQDNTTGGDCSLIGSWDTTSKTCTLTQDLSQGIIIDSDNIILDGNGRTITGSNTGNGVYLFSKTGVTVKNLNVQKFTYGIYVYGSNNTLTANTASNNSYGGILLQSSNNNTLTGNTASNNNSYGIILVSSFNNTLISNTAQENGTDDIHIFASSDNECNNNITNTTGSGGRPIKYFSSAVNLSNETLSELILCNADNSKISSITIDGSVTRQNNGLSLIMTDSSTIANVNSSNNYDGISLILSSGNILTGNTTNSNSRSGIFLYYLSNNNILTNNTVSNNNYIGIFLPYISSNNQIYKNNFISNSTQASVSGSGNVFNLASPIGGNYWSNYDEPLEGCNDLNQDNFCDSPYAFTGGQDNLPWTKKDGWLATSPNPMATCLGGNGRIPGLPNCLMPENLAGTGWNEVDDATGQVLNEVSCSVAVCGRNGEWRNIGYPPNSTYIQTPFDFAYWGQYFTNGVWQTGNGGIVQPGSSQIIYPTNQPPTITLLGDNPVSLLVGDTFIDPGATATDDIDGDLTMLVVWSNTVDTSVVGSYIVTYSVTDSGGLTGVATRTIDVIAVPPTNQSPTLSFLESSPDGLSENDSVQDNKGIADKTLFDFDVIYTDQDNDAPSSVRLIVEKVSQGAYQGYLDSEMSRFGPQEDYTSGQIYVVASNDLIKSLTFPKGDYRYRFEASDVVSSVQTPFVEFTAGYSNVMFLPGIEASRLYEPDGTPNGNELWLPGQTDHLELDINGLSATHPDIYTRDLIDSVLRIDFYGSFRSSMDSLKNDGIIADWKDVPYDWRLQLDQILASGNKTGDNISYLQETTAPYIIQELRRLAANSNTGKVSIIAHSNGGLVTKKLTDILGPEEASKLVDKIVFVAVPQVGTPAAIAGLLHGYDQDIGLGILLTSAEARKLGQNMPMTYNLLPSGGYFLSDNSTVVTTPVITFNASLPGWIEHYNGRNIDSLAGLLNFLSDPNTGDCHSEFSNPCRVSPLDSFTNFPATINPGLLHESSTLVHELSLDIWQPPPGVEFITVAGWGKKTLAQIEYKQVRVRRGEKEFTFTPYMVIDGDGTVVIPSALWEGPGVLSTRYWVDLSRYTNGSYDHGKIFATKPVQDLIGYIVMESSGPLPGYVSASEPSGPPIDRLDFTLHSPLTLGFVDADGNYSGSTATSTVLDIPGIDYERYGDVQWLSVPKGLTGKLVMHGTGIGSFSLDIAETSGNTEVGATSFEGIPSDTNTLATIDISPTQSVTENSTLIIDGDGDGTPDITLEAKQNAVVLFDSVAPTTTSLVSGIQWNGFYVGTTTVMFTAQDNPEGVGVAKTEYSFDNGLTWNNYIASSSVAIASEGTTTISFRSIDYFGNREATTTLVIKIDKTPPQLQLTASPSILWPPNHQMVKVTIGGFATDTVSGIDSVSFSFTDEYGKVQPVVSNFGDVIQLESWRNGNDLDGRLYTIVATAIDKAGNKTIASTTVISPHDQRK